MMTTVMGRDVADAARTWIGTPFVHQGRLKGVGVDCVGLVIGVARELGLTDYDFNAYGMQPDPRVLMREVEANLQAVPLGDAQAGDVLLFRFEREPQHFAIVVDTAASPWQIVHAHRKVGRCVQHGMDEIWRRRLLGAYRFPGI